MRKIMYDFIGDIHGHADHLKKLLNKLGYKKVDGVFQHKERKAFFLGDLIDSGPQVEEVLAIVKPMVESEKAKCILGNHEFNMLGLFLERDNSSKKDPVFYRTRSDDHLTQAMASLPFFLSKNQETKEKADEIIRWFYDLPLFYEEENFRVAHACWHEESIALLKKSLKGNSPTKKLIREASKFGKKNLYNAIELVLKGPEVDLPKKFKYLDSYGKERKQARICWWNEDEKLVLKNRESFKEEEIKKIPVNFNFASNESKLTFFGHYWQRFKEGKPFITHPKAQCLDFSVANKGHLVAYRFEGEDQIKESHFVWV